MQNLQRFRPSAALRKLLILSRYYSSWPHLQFTVLFMTASPWQQIAGCLFTLHLYIYIE